MKKTSLTEEEINILQKHLDLTIFEIIENQTNIVWFKRF